MRLEKEMKDLVTQILQEQQLKEWEPKKEPVKKQGKSRSELLAIVGTVLLVVFFIICAFD